MLFAWEMVFHFKASEICQTFTLKIKNKKKIKLMGGKENIGDMGLIRMELG